MSETIDIRYILNSDEITAESKKVDKAIAGSQKAVEVATEDMRENIAIQKQVIKELENQYRELQKVVKNTAPGAAQVEMQRQLSAAKIEIDAERKALTELTKAQTTHEQSTVSLRTQIMNMRNSMATMVEGTKEYSAAMLKLGELQDKMGDIQQQGRIYADDEKYFRTTTEAVQGLAGAMSVGVGVATLFGASQENLAKIQAKLQAVMAISIGVQQVAQVLNKDSYVSQILLTKAKTMHAAVQAKLTAALWGSATAAKAATIALTGGLIIAVWAIIAAYNKWSNAEDKQKKSAQETQKAQKDYNTSIVESVATQLVAYNKLQKSWTAIGENSKAQNKFIRDNKDEISKLGVSVKSAAEAENLFVTNSSSFVESLMLRAKAAATAELAVEKYKKIIAKQLEQDKLKPQTLPQNAQSMPGYSGLLAGQEAAKAIAKGEADKAQEEFDKLIAMEKDYLLQSKTLLKNTGISEIDNNQGAAAGKTISEAAKANQARIEAERELKERLVEIQFQTEQAVIDAQAEGYDRQMSQIKLNYNKKLVAIELWEREQRKMVENAQKAAYIASGGDEQKFKFNPADPAAANALTTISSSATAQRDAVLKGNVDEQTELLKKLKTQWQSWGDDYQQIEDKITKIQEDAAKARKEINARYKAGDINLREAGIALGAVDTGEAAQITDLNSQKTKLTASWSGMFRDLQGMSRGEVDKLIEAINEELKNKKLSAADASALFEQLGKAKEYSIGLNPFAAWVDSLGDVKTATEAVEVARQKVEQIKSTSSEKEKADAEKALQDAQKLLADSKERRAASASQSLSDISNIAGATSDLLKTFGVESPAVDGVVGALGSLASIDFTNPISVVTGGLQAIASLIGGIFGEMDSVKEKEIQRLQGKVDALEKSYEKLDKAIDKAYSSDASAMIAQQNEMLEKQKQLIRLQIEQEQAKKDSDGGKIKQWQDQLDALDEKIEENNEAKIDAIFGSDIKSAIADFASAYMDSWASGEDRAKSQKDVVKKMIQGIVTEIIKSNIADKVVALREALKNAIIDGVISETEQAAIDKLQDEIYAQSEADAKNYEKWLKDDDALQNENSLTGQIRGTVATEASVAELGGIFRGQYDKLASIDSNIGSGIGHLMDIARTNLLIEMNTRRTADNTDGLRDTLNSTNVRLDQVIKNTSKDNGSYGG